MSRTRKHLHHASPEAKRRGWIKQNAKYKSNRTDFGKLHRSVDVPMSVLSDRDRRALLEQPMLGDPPPGRSALDQRQGKR